MHRFLKLLMWAAVIFFVIFLGFLALGLWHQNDIKKTAAAVEKINSTKITLADVMGENLPPAPDLEINNATVAGIDANGNYIRDDVELEIFNRYPDSAKIRAGVLQYAQALQLQLTEVFNSETLVATIRKRAYGQSCIGESGPQTSLNDTSEKIKESLTLINNRIKEIEKLVWNNDIREKKYSSALDYMTTYSVPSKTQQCDIEVSTLK